MPLRFQFMLIFTFHRMFDRIVVINNWFIPFDKELE